jgi:hypothetical protein
MVAPFCSRFSYTIPNNQFNSVRSSRLDASHLFFVSERLTPVEKNKFCVMGAGACGLTVLKNFLAANIPVECLEREAGVGGNWNYGKPCSSVYKSAHLISSKLLTQFPDFPMPEEWPEYPSQAQALEYLQMYAGQFDLLRHIRFNTAVARVEPLDAAGSGWSVELANGERRVYRGVIIANGHHWDPNWPAYHGKFDGTVLHSSQYKTPDILVGKRVLVVGAGNSGCDIAVEAAQFAAKSYLSVRRGYHFIPKFLKGKPVDRCAEFLLKWKLPLWLRRRLTARAVFTALGNPEDYGLPKPDHQFLETHPIINSQLLYFMGHGRIAPKPDIKELCGNEVQFSDGTKLEIDTIVYATGYKLSFPFIDRSLLNWNEGKPELFLNAFHPRYDNLFVCGMIQPDSGLWGIAHYQAKLIAQFISLQASEPAKAEQFRRLKAQPQADLGHGIRYVHTPRHLLEVEHFSYRKRLKILIAEFE